MSSYTERIAKGGFVIFTLAMLTSIIGYLLRLYLARSLTIHEYGLFYAIMAFLSLIWVFKDMGISPALAKYIPEFYVKKRFSDIKTTITSIMLFQYITGFIIFVLLFILSDYISINFFHNASAKPILQILSIELAITVSVLRPVIQGLQKMGAYALVEFVRIIFVSIFVLSTISLGIKGIAISYLAASIIVQLIFLAYIFNITKKFKGPVQIRYDRKIFSFGFYVFIGSLAGFLVSYTDTLVLTFFRSLDEVGFYQVAMPTSQLLWVFVGTITVVMLPIMSEIWSKDQKQMLAEGVSLLVKFTLIFIIPFALILMSFPEIVLNLIFGPSYIGASTALQILSLGAVFYTLMTILSTAINAIGKPELNTKAIWIIALFNLAGNLVFVPIMGITGAAIISMLSFFLGFMILASYTRKYMTVKIHWSSFIKAFIGGIVTLLLIYFLKNTLIIENSLLEAFICSFVSFTVYFIFISATRAITRDDLKVFEKSNIYVPKIIRTIALKFIK